MALDEKISPLIWWLIIIFFLPDVYGAVANTYDFVGDGTVDIESEMGNARTRITGDGPIAASQALQFQTDLYSSTSLVDAVRGKLQIKTPEISLRSDALNLKAAAKLDYNTKQIMGEPEIIEDEEGNTWLEIENRTLHHENLRLQISGNGSMDEEILMALGHKSRKVFDYSTKGGNFSLNQSIQLSGLEMRKSFEMLPDAEKFDESEEEATIRATFGKVTA
ncbi:MAG TPA: hypothetical protein PLD96_03160 [Methanothrix sp.]|nr:hypothetical protein [Methanothrix sp.]HPM26315.1 hypothetical protein [Methanothrix sp.]